MAPAASIAARFLQLPFHPSSRAEGDDAAVICTTPPPTKPRISRISSPLRATLFPGILHQASCRSRHFPATSLPSPNRTTAPPLRRLARSAVAGRLFLAPALRQPPSGLRATAAAPSGQGGGGLGSSPRQKIDARSLLSSSRSLRQQAPQIQSPWALPSSSPSPGSRPLPSPPPARAVKPRSREPRGGGSQAPLGQRRSAAGGPRSGVQRGRPSLPLPKAGQAT